MRKFFMLGAILLLFIGTALANAPPVDMQDSQIEFVQENDFDMPADGILSIQVDEVALPLMFDMTGSLVPTIMVESSTLDVNLNTFNAYAIQASYELELTNDHQRSYSLSNRTNLAINEKSDNDYMGLSRLDIGELFNQKFYI